MVTVIFVNETPKGSRVFHCSTGGTFADLKVIAKPLIEGLLPKIDEVMRFTEGTYAFNFGGGTEATSRWERLR